MNMVEIERALRELRLSGIAETLSTRVMQAQASQEPFLETLGAMLQDELDRRRTRLLERRFKRSGLDEKVTLADFDWRFNPKLPRAACFELHTLKFIAEGANALIVGKPGTGKSHLAKAVEHPFRVIKRQFGYTKVKYRGLTKNTANLMTLFALSNLWMARRSLLQGLQG